jgi:DNA-binding protein HU-beta
MIERKVDFEGEVSILAFPVAEDVGTPSRRPSAIRCGGTSLSVARIGAARACLNVRKCPKETVMPPAKKTAPANKKASPPMKAATTKKSAPLAKAEAVKKAAVAPKKAPASAKPGAPIKKAAPAAKKSAAPSKKAVSGKGMPQATITLKQIAAELAESHDLPKKVAEAVLGDLVTFATRHLRNGDKIRLTGLGILQVRDRPARMGRNPATGESVQIAASKKIAFRPAKELKEAV